MSSEEPLATVNVDSDEVALATKSISDDEVVLTGSAGIKNIDVGQLSPSEHLPTTGEQITLSLDVTNDRSSDLSITVDFLEDGSQIDSSTQTVTAGSTVTYSTTVTKSSTGTRTYQADITVDSTGETEASNTVDVTWMNVDPGPLTASDTDVDIDASTTLSINVDNVTANPVEVQVEFLENGSVISTSTTTISASTIERFETTVSKSFAVTNDYTARVTEVGPGLSGLSNTVAVEWREIIASGDLAVSIASTNSPVGETATVLVDVNVTNNNDTTEDGVIVLDIAGAIQDDVAVTVDPGATSKITVAWETVDGDAGEYTAEVRSGTDSDTAPVTVEDVTNPGAKTHTVQDTHTFSDRAGGDVAETTIATSLTDIRFVEAYVYFSQEGAYYSDDAGVGFGIDTSGVVGNHDVSIFANPGEVFERTATFDLGSVKSGDLNASVDDGDAEISPPE